MDYIYEPSRFRKKKARRRLPAHVIHQMNKRKGNEPGGLCDCCMEQFKESYLALAKYDDPMAPSVHVCKQCLKLPFVHEVVFELS